MPRDALYEESAQTAKGSKEAKLYTVFNVTAWVLLVIAMIFGFLFFIRLLPYTINEYKSGNMGVGGLVLNIALWGGAALMLGLASFLTFRFRLRYNVSYDYLFVEDELRITKVFNGKKRKHVITMSADHMLQIGYCEGDTFERTLDSVGKPRLMTSNKEPAEEKQFVYILYSSPIGKELYILECKKELLEYVVRAAGRNKFIKE